jgi:hypothetical protein
MIGNVERELSVISKQQLQEMTDEQLQAKCDRLSIPWKDVIKHHDPKKSQNMSRAQMIAEITTWS